MFMLLVHLSLDWLRKFLFPLKNKPYTELLSEQLVGKCLRFKTKSFHSMDDWQTEAYSFE